MSHSQQTRSTTLVCDQNEPLNILSPSSQFSLAALPLLKSPLSILDKDQALQVTKDKWREGLKNTATESYTPRVLGEARQSPHAGLSQISSDLSKTLSDLQFQLVSQQGALAVKQDQAATTYKNNANMQTVLGNEITNIMASISSTESDIAKTQSRWDCLLSFLFPPSLPSFFLCLLIAAVFSDHPCYFLFRFCTHSFHVPCARRISTGTAVTSACECIDTSSGVNSTTFTLTALHHSGASCHNFEAVLTCDGTGGSVKFSNTFYYNHVARPYGFLQKSVDAAQATIKSNDDLIAAHNQELSTWLASQDDFNPEGKAALLIVRPDFLENKEANTDWDNIFISSKGGSGLPEVQTGGHVLQGQCLPICKQIVFNCCADSPGVWGRTRQHLIYFKLSPVSSVHYFAALSPTLKLTSGFSFIITG